MGSYGAWRQHLGRLACLVASTLVTCSVGPVMGFNVFGSTFKAYFRLSQFEAEMLSSLLYVSATFGVLAAFSASKHRRLTIGLGTLLTICSYSFIYGSTEYAEYFHQHSYLFYILFVLAGQGAVFSYLPTYCINLNNWGPKNRGKIMGIIQIPFQVGPILLSTMFYGIFALGHETDIENQDLPGFLLTVCILLGVFGFIAFCFTDDYTSLVDSVDEDSASETTPIISYDNESKKLLVFQPHSTLMEGVTNLDTQLIFWGQLLCTPPGFTILNNITFILQSFGWYSLNGAYTIAAPLLALIMKLIVGTLSDRYMHKISRVALNMICTLPFLLFGIINIFLGDQLVVLTLMYMFGTASCETAFCLLPISLCDRFHKKYFDYVYTMACFMPSVVVSLLQLLLGYVYDMQTPEGSYDCFQLDCYRPTYAVMAVMLILGVSSQCAFIYRQYQAKQRRKKVQDEWKNGIKPFPFAEDNCKSIY